MFLVVEVTGSQTPGCGLAPGPEELQTGTQKYFLHTIQGSTPHKIVSYSVIADQKSSTYNYDVIRAQIKTAEIIGINSTTQKTNINGKKCQWDYSI